uniref:Uncharacterized protein n=1 Tax=mine drainage metagenome TaxID=410659 RepID=E6QS61_9ZZZZ
MLSVNTFFHIDTCCSDHPMRRCKPNMFFKRQLSLIYLLLAMLMGIQLFALTQHHHDAGIDSGHCAACNLGHHFSTGSKSPSPSLILLSLVLIWLTLRLPVLTSRCSKCAYLRPGSQAPPQSS